MSDDVMRATRRRQARRRERIATAAVGQIWAVFQIDGTAIEHSDWRQGVAVEAVRIADELMMALDGGRLEDE